MPIVSVELDKEEVKILRKRAKKNLFSLKEQVEDIIRRSCVRDKKKSGRYEKVNDRLVGLFSRRRKGRPRKKR